MSRKTASNKNKVDSEVEVMEESLQTGAEPEKVPETQGQDIQEAIESQFGEVLLSGKGKKLSPKSNSHVYFEVAARKSDNQLHIRLTGNDDGGLHSKEFISLQTLFDILEQQKEKSFKSSVFASAFKGGSSNNKSFMAAAIRSDAIGLITPAPNSLFSHVLAPNYDERRDQLLALVDADTTTETTA
ncbi:hypothetical protein ACFKIX_000445 [Vibrio alginolyticus]